uniref:speckle targeted PIP5K1A-regulated poly(A) polymerase n=1 Tax=Ciona intestinalis TaxID=7719 RepID=UPI000180D393|nr:speckle targeted PIP5K1A-regulated poly(A) polymerase [Ciona intestinalis]|eukprot:XP_002130666.1 speckle targeted PIP5K1A-regulated poly(A) polymerase [Ciona intestinalis]
MTSVKQKQQSRNGTQCEVCSVFVPNEASMRDHLKGRKHIRNVEKQEHWLDSAVRSVYVSGLKSLSAAELSLADYFSSFGAVKKVTIDKTAKHYAIIEMDSTETVDKILEKEKHTILGVNVDVRLREIKPCKGRSKSQENEQGRYLSNETWTALFGCATVEEQVHTLKHLLMITEDDDYIRNLICKLLGAALDEAFPGCEVQPFGSSVNGFGVHGCDLDLNFDYSSIHDDVMAGITQNMHETGTAEVSAEDMDRSHKSGVLLAIAEIIKQCVPDCHKIKTILNARLPVVRFYHKTSGVRCDISLKNDLAIHNTQYLQLCSQLTPNFSLLVFLIRAWMKHWKLAGNLQFNGTSLNNYAVTLLVLFYMQNCNCIPKLKDLRKYSKTIKKIECFDCTIPDTPNLVVSACHTNDTPLLDLVSGFFAFYTNIDFVNVVIDLSVNKIVSVSDDQLTMELHTIKSKFKYSALNIRDPFEVSHNVAANVNQKHMKTFIRCTRNTTLVTKMKKYSQKPLSGNAIWGIMMLFVDQHNKNEAGEKHAHKGKETEHSFLISPPPSELVDQNTLCQTAGQFVITVLQDVFYVKIGKTTTNQTFTEDFSVSPEIHDLTESIAVIQACPPSNQNNDVILHQSTNDRKRHADDRFNAPCKKSRISIVKNVIENPSTVVQLPVKLSCIATQKVWQGRRKARRQIVQSGLSDLVQLERKISELLLSESSASAPNESLNDSTSSDLSISMHFHLTMLAEEQKLKLTFEPGENSTDFVTFFHHIEVFLPPFVAKCMKRM